MRPHTKSHAGCEQCKHRKVKCDETKPCCQRCARRGASCSYLELFSHPSPFSSTYSSDAPRGRGQPGHFHAISPAEPNGRSVADVQYDRPIDIELTHFYSTKTWETLWFRPQGQTLWRDAIFNHALSYPALINAILATAAMHKVTTVGSVEEIARTCAAALRKQGEALNAFIELLNGPNAENCVALFPLSVLIMYWGFASRNLPPELNIMFFSPEDSSRPWMPIHGSDHDSPITRFLAVTGKVQGVHLIVRETRPWLQEGELKELVKAPDMDTLPEISTDANMAVTALEEHLQGTNIISILEAERRSSVLSLRSQLRLRHCPEWYDVIIGWPIILPAAFVQELSSRSHPALVVLAYWAVCLHALDERWWAHGWAKALIMETLSVVGEPWIRHLEWAKHSIGLP